MSQIVKAKVLKGAHLGLIVRITNISVDGEGKQRAACFLPNGTRANIPLNDLEILPEEKLPETPKRPQSSMPFVSGSTGSRSLNQTRSLVRDRIKPEAQAVGHQAATCEQCGEEYNLLERKGKVGKVTVCPECAGREVVR